MALRAFGGAAELRLDGKSIVQADGKRDELVRNEIAVDKALTQLSSRPTCVTRPAESSDLEASQRG